MLEDQYQSQALPSYIDSVKPQATRKQKIDWTHPELIVRGDATLIKMLHQFVSCWEWTHAAISETNAFHGTARDIWYLEQNHFPNQNLKLQASKQLSWNFDTPKPIFIPAAIPYPVPPTVPIVLLHCFISHFFLRLLLRIHPLPWTSLLWENCLISTEIVISKIYPRHCND